MSRRIRELGVVAVALAAGLSAVPAEAQTGMGRRGMGPGTPGGPNIGHSLELALENQEKLELTGDQAAQLQALQKIMDEEVAPLAEEMRVLRESIRDGTVDREDGFREMEALRGRIITAGAPLRGGVAEVLTVQQHNRLQALVREERPGMGRGGALPGRGGSGLRGGGALGPRGRGGAGMNPARTRGARGIPGAGMGMDRQGSGRGFGLRQGMRGGQFPRSQGGRGIGPGCPVGGPGDPGSGR